MTIEALNCQINSPTEDNQRLDLLCGCACVEGACSCVCLWWIGVCGVWSCVACVVSCGVCCGVARWKPQCVHSIRPRACVQNVPVCTGNMPTCIKHVGMLPVHTGTFWTHTRGRVECTHGGVRGGGEGEGKGEAGQSPVLLTKISHRGLSLDPREAHQKQPLDFTHLRFESRLRTTCHRFLQPFAISDKSVSLQLSWGKRAERNVMNDLHVSIATSHHEKVSFGS